MAPSIKFNKVGEKVDRKHLDSIETDTLFICAHDDAIGLRCGDKKKINHWVIYAQAMELMSSSIKSVRFDMTSSCDTGEMSNDCLMGQLHVEALKCQKSRRVVKTFEVKLAQGTTVGQIISLIYENHYLAYDFTPENIGCRYWIKSTLELLSSNGLVDTSNTLKAINGMSYAWSEGQEHPIPAIPIAHGTFHFRK